MTIHREESGQVIAIYAVALLLVSLMTLLTISIGVRVREKIKVQSAADASAYGLAVSQARAMNTMAWANRAMVAEYVSMLSVIGHESYLNYWENLARLQNLDWLIIAGELTAECAGCAKVPCLCPACSHIGVALDIANLWMNKGPGAYTKIHQKWHGGQGKALHQALNAMDNGYIGMAAAAYAQGAMAYAKYIDFTGQQKFAQANGKVIDPRIKKYADSSTASFTQFKKAVTVSPAPADWDVYQEILTGTRTGWIHTHGMTASYFDAENALEIQKLTASGCKGGSGWDVQGGAMTMLKGVNQVGAFNHAHTHAYQLGNARGEGGRLAASAVDSGMTGAGMFIIGSCAGGGMTLPGSSFQYQETGQGSYHKAADGSDDSTPDWGNGLISPDGSGITVGYFRFKIANDPAERVLWNQPRTYASLQMDVTKDKDENPVPRPWDFNFGQIGGSLLTVKGGSGKGGYDNTGSGTDLAKVRGFGAGLTYYHNPTAWREVPNLWNPFWRAKLDQPFNAHENSGVTQDDQTVATTLGYF